MRILIVEDEPTLGTQLKNTLEGAGYAVDLATDGEDGHYLGSTESYDAVILDLGLPDVSGERLLGMIRAASAVPRSMSSTSSSKAGCTAWNSPRVRSASVLPSETHRPRFSIW